jgi:hypothetical protein
VEAEAQAQSQLEQLNRDLEQAVTARTAELEAQVEESRKTEDALRQSQKMESQHPGGDEACSSRKAHRRSFKLLGVSVRAVFPAI